MTTDDERGTGIDDTVPHFAWIWNHWLRGKDNYPVDREAGDAWLAVAPEARIVQQYAETGAVACWNRYPEEIKSLFDGLEFVEPGFVQVP
jgi:hypothetical protein